MRSYISPIIACIDIHLDRRRLKTSTRSATKSGNMRLSAALCFLLSLVIFCEARSVEERVPSARIRRSVALTEVDKWAIVNRHNYYRRQEGAANMKKMKWNDYLANMATEWVDNCVYEHGQPLRPAEEMPFSRIGQNMALSSTDRGLPWTIDQYFMEKSDYSFNESNCWPGKACGHYTQVVWANSSDVGCAAKLCPALSGLSYNKPLWFYVCNYGPAGNVNGQKPFVEGPACSQCPPSGDVCVGGLCVAAADAEKPDQSGCSNVCLNGGSIDPIFCTCNCTIGWTGADCGAPCADDRTCPYRNVSDCSWCPNMKRLCPSTCNFCKALPTTPTPTTTTTTRPPPTCEDTKECAEVFGNVPRDFCKAIEGMEEACPAFCDAC